MVVVVLETEHTFFTTLHLYLQQCVLFLPSCSLCYFCNTLCFYIACLLFLFLFFWHWGLNPRSAELHPPWSLYSFLRQGFKFQCGIIFTLNYHFVLFRSLKQEDHKLKDSLGNLGTPHLKMKKDWRCSLVVGCLVCVGLWVCSSVSGRVGLQFIMFVHVVFSLGPLKILLFTVFSSLHYFPQEMYCYPNVSLFVFSIVFLPWTFKILLLTVCCCVIHFVVDVFGFLVHGLCGAELCWLNTLLFLSSSVFCFLFYISGHLFKCWCA